MDWSNLSRNFEEEPLKKISNKLEDLSYEDLSYLVENFSFCDITKILKISDNYLRRQLKIHNLKTKIDHRRKYPKRTIEEKEIDKYGKLGLTHKEKLQITYKKYPEIKNAVDEINTYALSHTKATKGDFRYIQKTIVDRLGSVVDIEV